MCILKDNTAWRMLYGAPAFQGVLVAFEAWWFMLTLWAAFHFTRVVQASVLKRRSANAVIKLTYGCMCPACALRVVYYGSLLVAVFRGRDVFCDTKRFPSVLIIRDLFYALLLIVFSGLAIFWFALDNMMPGRFSEVSVRAVPDPQLFDASANGVFEVGRLSTTSVGAESTATERPPFLARHVMWLFWTSSLALLVLWVGIDVVNSVAWSEVRSSNLRAIQFGLFGVVCFVESGVIMHYGRSLLRTFTLPVSGKRRTVFRLKMLVLICSVAFMAMGALAILVTFEGQIKLPTGQSLGQSLVWSSITTPLLGVLELVLASTILYTIRAPDPKPKKHSRLPRPSVLPGGSSSTSKNPLIFGSPRTQLENPMRARISNNKSGMVRRGVSMPNIGGDVKITNSSSTPSESFPSSDGAGNGALTQSCAQPSLKGNESEVTAGTDMETPSPLLLCLPDDIGGVRQQMGKVTQIRRLSARLANPQIPHGRDRARSHSMSDLPLDQVFKVNSTEDALHGGQTVLTLSSKESEDTRRPSSQPLSAPRVADSRLSLDTEYFSALDVFQALPPDDLPRLWPSQSPVHRNSFTHRILNLAPRRRSSSHASVGLPDDNVPAPAPLPVLALLTTQAVSLLSSMLSRKPVANTLIGGRGHIVEPETKRDDVTPEAPPDEPGQPRWLSLRIDVDEVENEAEVSSERPQVTSELRLSEDTAHQLFRIEEAINEVSSRSTSPRPTTSRLSTPRISTPRLSSPRLSGTWRLPRLLNTDLEGDAV